MEQVSPLGLNRCSTYRVIVKNKASSRTTSFTTMNCPKYLTDNPDMKNFSFTFFTIIMVSLSGCSAHNEKEYSATELYRLSMEEDDTLSELLLGMKYESGDGVPKDQYKAAYWYRKAADKGDATAQAFLGLMYEEGRGVKQDKKIALTLYRSAVRQGDNFALGFMERLEQEELEATPSKHDKVDQQTKAIELCSKVSRREWLNQQGEDSSKQRYALAGCLDGGSLPSKDASAEIIKIEDVAANSKGIQLEQYNIWFYKLAPDGKQQASINIYHPTISPISWVVVGFHPVCGSEEGYKWALRLKLPAPASPQENAAWVWEVPKGLALSDNACLDILSAG